MVRCRICENFCFNIYFFSKFNRPPPRTYPSPLFPTLIQRISSPSLADRKRVRFFELILIFVIFWFYRNRQLWSTETIRHENSRLEGGRKIVRAKCRRSNALVWNVQSYFEVRTWYFSDFVGEMPVNWIFFILAPNRARPRNNNIWRRHFTMKIPIISGLLI